MRERSAFWISMIAILVLSAVLIGVSRAQAPRIYVDPPSVSLPPASTFTVDIMIADVGGAEGLQNCSAWEFKISWNSEVLYSDTSKITQGPWLATSSGVSTQFQIAVITPTQILIGELVTEPGQASGSGVLASIEFTVVGEGSSPLDVSETQILDYDGYTVSHSVTDGSFNNIMLMSATVTGKSAWPEHHHFSITKDEDHIQTLNSKVVNDGPNPAYVRVYFEVAKDSGVVAVVEAKYIVNDVETKVEPGQTVYIDGNCWPSPELAWAPGKYYVNASAKVSYYGLGWFDGGGKTKAFSFAIVP